jgi:very-short-patch-repair endonuclease
MASLQAALKAAIQVAYELEDRELAVEPLPGPDDRRAILIYEATEGGLGALSRLVSGPDEVARVGRIALELCHFDPDTGEDRHRATHAREDCEAACYDCLLSYTNQRDHDILDRHVVRDELMAIARAQLGVSPTSRNRAEQLESLLRVAGSELERKWLRQLEKSGLNLPTDAQVLFDRCETRPDFVYENKNVVVYVDGPPHEFPERAERDARQAECMEDAGWVVIRFGHTDDWGGILDRHKGVFGGRS